MRADFMEESICQRQANLLSSGALAVETGQHTGRAASSRFIVRDRTTEKTIDWGEVNKPFTEDAAGEFFREIQLRLAQSRVFTVNGFIGPFPIEVQTTSAWHAAFADNMFRTHFIERLADQAASVDDGYGTIRIWHDPFTKASSYGIDSREEAMILLDPARFSIGICGTAYAGEIKKSAFSMANYLLPLSRVLPMHASANCLHDGSRSCVIFGLSGTGKTTLSAQGGRFLIGDDEIAWSETGLSNLEGGCYAKLINLTKEKEPDIFNAVNRFGSILENVVYNKNTRVPDFTSRALTENTRGSYKLAALDRVFTQSCEAYSPETIVFLTADAFGALPAVARLDEWQMRYHFMSGFTAKVAGTEIGLKAPQATFSACFGAPFMPRTPSIYAHLLAARARAAGASVWLLNTGWVGGYERGRRFPLALTRRILEMIQSGELMNSEFMKHPVFGFDVPLVIKGIDSELVRTPTGPQVELLAKLFIQNQEKFHDPDAREISLRGGPSLRLVDETVLGSDESMEPYARQGPKPLHGAAN
jgi:phosphoenolpyruvate carboxykinase (ATP)